MDAIVAPRQAAAAGDDAQGLRVVIVSGVRFRREALAEVFERDPLVTVVKPLADLFEAAALSPALQPDVLLVDVGISEGAAAVRRAIEMAPGMRIIVFAVRETEDDIIAWAEAGAIGYIPSTAALADLVRLVADIHGGRQPCSSRVAAGLLRRIALGGAARRPPSLKLALTQRERQVAELIMSGLSDKEIARRLSISLATTKSHVHNLLGKLNLPRRGEVADYLREHDRNPH